MNGHEFNKMLLELAVIIENRTIQHPKLEKQEAYEDGEFNPTFSVIAKDGGEIVCVWCGNRRKDRFKKVQMPSGRYERVLVRAGEPEIVRLSGVRVRSGHTGAEFEDIAMKAVPYWEKHKE